MDNKINKAINSNQNHYYHNKQEKEPNTLNYKKELNISLKNYEKNLQCQNEAINALIKLDMSHATNNYYNNIIESRNTYKVFIRSDGKPDYGNYTHFNRYVKFDPEKYKKPEIYYGYIHDQYIVPHILHGINNDNNNKRYENEKNNIGNKKKEFESNTKNKIQKDKNNKISTIKSLDDIMNKYNLKYIEYPLREKKVEELPKEVSPEEEEDKDKSKGKKDNGKTKINTKDDKVKNNKSIKQ